MCLDILVGIFSEVRLFEFEEFLKYIDFVLLDIKYIDDECYKWLIGVSNKNILKFVRLLSDKKIFMILRYIFLL